MSDIPGAIFDLHGKVALITGASGGIGRATAVVFAQQGAELILTDRDLAACEQVAAECDAQGARVTALAADMSNQSEVETLADRALARHGAIDVLVCNAGIQPISPLHEVTAADWDRLMQINLRSAHTLCARFAPEMGRRGGGAIILMASITALRGAKGLGLYAMSKAALAQMARNLALEWGPQGVRANALAPGLIRSPMTERFLKDQSFTTRRLAATPLRRVGEPYEVAGVAAMLASAAGGFVSGQTIVIDGGTLISDGN